MYLDFGGSKRTCVVDVNLRIKQPVAYQYQNGSEYKYQ